MVLQRGEPLPVWGRSVRGGQSHGHPGREYRCFRRPPGGMESHPAGHGGHRTDRNDHLLPADWGERHFHNVAVGEVWLAGGQSNMEFLLKYDEQAPEMLETPEDTPGSGSSAIPRQTSPAAWK